MLRIHATLMSLALASPALAQFYLQQNLVSDMPAPPGGAPKIIDPLLINPWGLVASSTSPLWSANQRTGTATVYSVNGTTGVVAKAPLTVTIPGSLTGVPNGPTGEVFSGGTDFVVSSGGTSGPARFLFSALNGTTGVVAKAPLTVTIPGSLTGVPNGP